MCAVLSWWCGLSICVATRASTIKASNKKQEETKWWIIKKSNILYGVGLFNPRAFKRSNLLPYFLYFLYFHALNFVETVILTSEQKLNKSGKLTKKIQLLIGRQWLWISCFVPENWVNFRNFEKVFSFVEPNNNRSSNRIYTIYQQRNLISNVERFNSSHWWLYWIKKDIISRYNVLLISNIEHRM